MRFLPRLPGFPAILLWFLVFAAWRLPDCSAQVAVYDLSFQRAEDRSINFSFFDGGYLAMDLVTGTGTFLLTFRDLSQGAQQPCFIEATEAAEAFTAVQESLSKTVVRATSQTGTALAHYLATGDIDLQIPIEIERKPVTVRVASRLSGQVLASDTENDVQFDAGHPVIAFAGMASFQLTLNPDFTSEANRRSESLAECVQTLTHQLTTLGFRNAREDGTEQRGAPAASSQPAP